MATTSEPIIFEFHPIKEGLATVRCLFKTTHEDLGVSVSSDAVQAIFSTATNAVGRRLLLYLLNDLQIQPAAQLLPSRVGDRTLLGDLNILCSRIVLNQGNIASAIPLVKQVVDNEGDGPVWNDVESWHAVFDLVAQSNTPLPPAVLDKAVLNTHSDAARLL